MHPKCFTALKRYVMHCGKKWIDTTETSWQKLMYVGDHADHPCHGLDGYRLDSIPHVTGGSNSWLSAFNHRWVIFFDFSFYWCIIWARNRMTPVLYYVLFYSVSGCMCLCQVSLSQNLWLVNLTPLTNPSPPPPEKKAFFKGLLTIGFP